MARTIATIQAEIMTAIAHDFDLRRRLYIAITSGTVPAFCLPGRYCNSRRKNRFRIFCKPILKTTVATSTGNAEWIQAQIFKFQYSATSPQVIQFNTTTFAPYYPVVNAALRIISECAVVNSNAVLIKVATGTRGCIMFSFNSCAGKLLGKK